MCVELSRIMSYISEHNSVKSAFDDNVAGKLSKSNVSKTNGYLRQLYGFNDNDPFFRSFLWFWKKMPDDDHPLLTILFAIQTDYLLSESIDILTNTDTGQKVEVKKFEENVIKCHPGRFSPATLRSVAQNIASSWKQAGFIQGKTKIIRIQPVINMQIVVFALLMAYLEGLRGEFLLNSKYIRILGLNESDLLELIAEASKRDLLEYQHSGYTTTISFNNLLINIGIHAGQN